MPARQGYVSDKLTHFVGRSLLGREGAQYDLLLRIVKDGVLKTSADAPAVRRRGRIDIDRSKPLSGNECYLPYCVCFCEIPEVDFEIHMTKYGRCGLVFTKDFLVQQGASPVLYVARDSVVYGAEQIIESAERGLPPAVAAQVAKDLRAQGASEGCKLRAHETMDRILPEYLALTDQLIGTAPPFSNDAQRQAHSVRRAMDFHILAYLKFFDHTLRENDPCNWYMEREWRVLGNVFFAPEDVSSVIVPKAYQGSLEQQLPALRGKTTTV